MELFDTHMHVNTSAFDEDRWETIKRAKEAGVKHMAVVGFNINTINQALEMTSQDSDLKAIIGWHPTEAINYNKEAENFLLERLDCSDVVALGETGLDYYWEDSPHDVQDKVFRRQIAIAKEFKLPIIIHNRDATEDVYKILKEENVQEIGGIMHSFGEGPEWVQPFLDLGMHISFSGVATFKKTNQVREASLKVPDNRILIETDAPYLSPVPKRGKRNEPAYVTYVAEVLAELRQMSTEDFASLTSRNAKKLFRMES